MKKLLVVIDYQNDFVNGALGFKKAEELDKQEAILTIPAVTFFLFLFVNSFLLISSEKNQ